MNWKTYVMFHKVLKEENYTCDPSFNFDNYEFIRANNLSLEYNPGFFTNITNEFDFEFYDPRLQKANYFAPTVIYHAYKNNLHKDLDYIGFIEYDIPLVLPDCFEGNSLTDYTKSILKQNQRVIVAYRYAHSFEHLYNRSNLILGGKNAVEQIFEDYNNFWGTKHEPQDFLEQNLVTQQSFIADRETFDKIMQFISYFIEQRLAERPNSWSLPATILERCFGIAILLEKEATFIPLNLKHDNMELWNYPKEKKPNFFSRLIKKIF